MRDQSNALEADDVFSGLIGMKKPPPKKSQKKKKTFGNAKPSPSIPEVEVKQGAWGKFGALIRRATKMGHKPHSSSKPKNRKLDHDA